MKQQINEIYENENLVMSKKQLEKSLLSLNNKEVSTQNKNNFKYTTVLTIIIVLSLFFSFYLVSKDQDNIIKYIVIFLSFIFINNIVKTITYFLSTYQVKTIVIKSTIEPNKPHTLITKLNNKLKIFKVNMNKQKLGSVQYIRLSKNTLKHTPMPSIGMFVFSIIVITVSITYLFGVVNVQ